MEFKNKRFLPIAGIKPISNEVFKQKNFFLNIKKKLFFLEKLNRKLKLNKKNLISQFKLKKKINKSLFKKLKKKKTLNLNIRFIKTFLSKKENFFLIRKKNNKKEKKEKGEDIKRSLIEKYDRFNKKKEKGEGIKKSLIVKYDKFNKKRDYLFELKKKKIRLNFSISKLVNLNYLNKVNYYIYSNKNEDYNLNLFISKFRTKNIFIRIVNYYPKLFIGEIPTYKNKDYIYAYWNLNSLYFKFIGFLIREGKRSKAEKIFNNTIFFIKEFISINPIFFFFQSIYNSQPLFEYIKHKKRYKTLTVPRITPYHKRLNLSMRSISKNIRNSELLRKFKNAKSKNKTNSSYLLYNLFVSSFFIKGKIKKELKDNLENAFTKRHLFRKGSLSNKNFKYNKLLKFMSFRKIRGYHF
jgi:ribosomal protein S7